jgi:hypothetical protein
MGVVKIVADVEDPYLQTAYDHDFWQRGDPDPKYYIIDDQYNGVDRYLYAELHGDDPFNPEWLASVAATLREYPGWGLCINHIPDSYVIIFGKRLMVHGRILSRCKTATEVVEKVRYLLRRGVKKWWQIWR